MPRPICVSCALEMRVIKNGVAVNDKAVDNFPATFWEGDLYECPGCKHRIVTGFGEKPVVPVDGSLEFGEKTH